MSVYGTIPLIVNVKARVDEVRQALARVSRDVGSFARRTATTAVTTPIFHTGRMAEITALLRDARREAINFTAETSTELLRLQSKWAMLIQRLQEHDQAVRGLEDPAKRLSHVAVEQLVDSIRRAHDAMERFRRMRMPSIDQLWENVRRLQNELSRFTGLSTLVGQFNNLRQQGRAALDTITASLTNFGNRVWTAIEPVRSVFRSLSIDAQMALGTINRWFQQNIVSAGQARQVWADLQQRFPALQHPLESLRASVIAVREVFRELGERTVEALRPITSTLTNVIGRVRELHRRLRENVEQAQASQRGFKLSGTRLAWFGFRLVMVGRILSRYLTNPLQKGLANLRNWQGAITQLGFGMGFLASQGLLSGTMFQQFQDVLMGMPMAGMQMQAVMAALSLIFLRIAQDVLPVLLPAILDLVSALLDVWDVVGEDVIDVIKDMAEIIRNDLLPLIRDFGPDMMRGMVKGFKSALSIMTKVLRVMKPYIPTLSQIAGLLVGLSPLLIAAGFGLYFLSIPIQAAVSLFGFLAGALKSVGLFFAGLLTSITGFFALIGGILAVGTAMEMMGIDTNIILDKIGQAFGMLGDKIATFVSGVDWEKVWESLKTFAGNLWEHVKTWAGSAATALLEWFSDINWTTIFTGLKSWWEDFWTNVKTWAGDATDALTEWFGTIDWDAVWASLISFFYNLASFVGTVMQDIGSTIAEWIGKVDWHTAFTTVVSTLSNVMGRLVAGLGGVIYAALIEIDWAGLGTWIAAEVFSPIIDLLTALTQDPLTMLKKAPEIAKWVSENIGKPFLEGVESSADAIKQLQDELEAMNDTRIQLIDDLMEKFEGTRGEALRFKEELRGMTDNELQAMKEKMEEALTSTEDLKGSVFLLNDSVDTATETFQAGSTQINNYNIDLDNIVSNAPHVVQALDDIKDAVTALGNEARKTGNALDTITDAKNTFKDVADVADDVSDGLDDVADNMNDASDAIEDAADSMNIWLKREQQFERLHDRLFATSVGSDIMRNMEEATRGFEMASRGVMDFSTLAGGTAVAPIMGAGRGGVTTQYIYITLEFHDVQLSSDIDLDELTQAISYKLADKLKEELR